MAEASSFSADSIPESHLMSRLALRGSSRATNKNSEQAKKSKADVQASKKKSSVLFYKDDAKIHTENFI